MTKLKTMKAKLINLDGTIGIKHIPFSSVPFEAMQTDENKWYDLVVYDPNGVSVLKEASTSE